MIRLATATSATGHHTSATRCHWPPPRVPLATLRDKTEHTHAKPFSHDSTQHSGQHGTCRSLSVFFGAFGNDLACPSCLHTGGRHASDAVFHLASPAYCHFAMQQPATRCNINPMLALSSCECNCSSRGSHRLTNFIVLMKATCAMSLCLWLRMIRSPFLFHCFNNHFAARASRLTRSFSVPAPPLA